MGEIYDIIEGNNCDILLHGDKVAKEGGDAVDAW